MTPRLDPNPPAVLAVFNYNHGSNPRLVFYPPLDWGGKESATRSCAGVQPCPQADVSR
jgi:hypothetical protein